MSADILKQISEHEIVSNHPQILDIRYLTDQDCVQIRERVIQDMGEVLVLVHPFFNHGREEDPYNDILQYYHSNRQCGAISESRVVFIFEGPDNYDRTKFKISLQRGNPLVVMIPTANSTPIPQKLDKTNSISDQWENVVDTLINLGVSKIRIGGREFYYGINGIGGCVPMAEQILSKSFLVTFEPVLCYPDEPIQLNRNPLDDDNFGNLSTLLNMSQAGVGI